MTQKAFQHDEVEENGAFTVTAMWEEVSPEDILTPQEVFAIMQKEGLRVDYERLPGMFFIFIFRSNASLMYETLQSRTSRRRFPASFRASSSASRRRSPDATRRTSAALGTVKWASRRHSPEAHV